MTKAGELVVTAGRPMPFGATPVPGGINFSVPSTAATGMTLVLFRAGAQTPFAELPFEERFRIGGVYAMTVLGLAPEEIEYGYRADGPFQPAAGHRFDRERILFDPYTRAFGGRSEWGVPIEPLAVYPYRSTVVTGDFDWGGDRPLGLPLRELVVYEAHLRGFTRHPSSGVARPGTFAGFAERIPHLRELGVNCVELLPVFEFDECDTVRHDPATGRRLTNYWGYSTLGFFAPKASYAAADPVRELKELVRALHAAGIEVILDVVLNHTAEGNEHGPTLSFRGLDNRVFYLLTPEGGYHNFSGTGNTVNANNPVVRAFVLDVLRYWVHEYHVDGFRFDLASALTRAPDGTPLADPPLLEAIATDPMLTGTKLIAEAWDAGGLYQVGEFPGYGRFSEWNGRYRDTVRRFVKGDGGLERELADRLLGSPSLYAGRAPGASVNFVTAHDGFTLQDLFSYNEKHNEANGEDNRDGEPVNHSWNCGTEGPTDDPGVLALRGRLVRTALTLLLLSRGVPMLTAGDEFGRSQGGNNNAYCQDNEVSWLDWTLAGRNAGLVRFTSDLISFRHAHPAVREPGGAEVTTAERLVCVTFRHGPDVVRLMANAGWDDREVELPAPPEGCHWAGAVDTAAGTAAPFDLPDRHRLRLGARSAIVLTAVTTEGNRK